MYESHFGLSGPPFQLVPDPGFFFGSRGHSNALAFLQSAAHQGDGFLVVTGEIGAGKTTLVRTLLEGLDAKQVQAATMVSTQLESDDLPLAILLAFGAPQAAAESKSQLNAALEAFLIDLAGKGRRALLIVDEAQNLSRALVEELRMLSNLQLGSNALLQVFLVGQPELRTQMQGKAMEQLRQRVTASCHLGPMDSRETRAYVEHRLRRVGWADRPPIESYAYEQIHHWTAGIPRRINRLCNRLLLATFLERKDAVTAEAVEQIARDLRAEIGESEEQPKMEESYVSAPAPAAHPADTPVPAAAGAPLAVVIDVLEPPAHAAVADSPAGPAVPAVMPGPDSAAIEVAPAVAEIIASTLAPMEASNETSNEASNEASNDSAHSTAADSAAPAQRVPTPDAESAAIPDALINMAALPAFSLAQQARSALGTAPTASEALPVPAPPAHAGDLAAASRPVEPAIDEEDEGARDVAVPPPVHTATKPHGVVAAHETALPPLKDLLSPGGIAAGRAGALAAPRPIAPTAPPKPAPSAAADTRIGSESRGAPVPAVDVPLDLFMPPAPPKGATTRVTVESAHKPSAVRVPTAGEASPASTLASAKAILEPLVCLVDSRSDYIKARALGRVLSDHRELPSVLIVHTASVANLDVGEEISGVMPQKAADVHLDVNEHGGAASAALAITRFDAVLRVYRPKAILAMGCSDTLLTCALFAQKSGVPILRNDAGRRRAWSRPGEEMNAMLLERLADTSYISDLATYYTLYRSGIPTDRVLLVGNLADNVLHFAARHTVHPADILRRVGAPADLLANPRGYALCSAQFDAPRASHDDVTGLISMLTLVARELPVLWAVNDATRHELKSQGKLAGLKAARIDVAPSLRYLDGIDLLRGARCLLAGSAGHFLDDAVTLGVRSIVLGQGLVVPVNSTEALQLSSPLGADQLPSVLADLLASPLEPRDKASFWDGAAAARIATHLSEWLPLHGANKKRGAPAPATTAPPRPKHPDAAIELLGAAAS